MAEPEVGEHTMTRELLDRIDTLRMALDLAANEIDRRESREAALRAELEQANKGLAKQEAHERNAWLRVEELTDSLKAAEALIETLKQEKAQLADELDQWRRAAQMIGERLTSIGPDSYYAFNAEQWRVSG